MERDTAVVPIRYSDFWDVPRRVVAEHDGQVWLFDCPFSDELDDYPDEYTVFVLDSVAADASWDDIRTASRRQVGAIPIRDVVLDYTRRASIQRRTFARIAPR